MTPIEDCNKRFIDKIEAELEAHRKRIAAADDPVKEFYALMKYFEWLDEASEQYNKSVGSYFFLNVYASDETDEYAKRFIQLNRPTALKEG